MLCLNEKIGNEHQQEENWLLYQSIKVSAGQQRDSRMLPQEGGLSRVLPIRQQKVPSRTNLRKGTFQKLLSRFFSVKGVPPPPRPVTENHPAQKLLAERGGTPPLNGKNLLSSILRPPLSESILVLVRY